MDLYIHTLTGTAFELRVSPFETIMSIKAKIQRLEGIPISQQHLIWRSVELKDDFCLHDYNICDGATLQLVLAMRGGPINTRRVPMEDPSLQEMAEYMEANQDEIWDRLPKDNRQVTLLVFRDGDQLNFFRVVDRGDGTLTPLSDSLSGASMYNLYDEEEEESQKPVSQETLKENKVTMNKMKLLRHKLQSQKITKLSTQRVNILMHDNAETLPEGIFEKPTIVVFATEQPEMLPHPPSVEKPKTTAPSARRRLRLSDASHKQQTSQKITPKKPEKSNTKSHLPHPPPPMEANGARKGGGGGSGETKARGPLPPPLPPVNTKKGKQIDVSDFLPNTQDSKPVTNLNNSLTRSAFKDGRRSISELVKDAKEIKPLGSISKPKVTSKHKTSSPQYGDSVEYHLSGSARLRRSKNNNSALRTSVSPNGDNLEYISGGSTLRRSRIPEEYLQSGYQGEVMPASAGLARLRGLENRVHTPDSRQNGFRNNSSSYKHQHNHERSVAPPHHLPPVKTHPPQLVQSKKKTRCFFCGKKTGLATTFQCRCGNTFCGTHRYAEVHGCTYDYKSEGRKIIEQNNPVVAAPKLPKI